LAQKYIYCNLPFFDKKGECLTYGAKCDRVFNLQYDRAVKKVKGGVSDSQDVYESKALAEDGGSTLVTRIDLDPTENEVGKMVHKLGIQNHLTLSIQNRISPSQPAALLIPWTNQTVRTGCRVNDL